VEEMSFRSGVKGGTSRWQQYSRQETLVEANRVIEHLWMALKT